MTIRMELDLPYPGESMSFGDLRSFVEQVRAAGATADTDVVGVAPRQDDSMLISLKVELEEFGSRPTDVGLSRHDVRLLLDVLKAVEDNEGDARSVLSHIRELRDRITQRVLE